MEMCRLHLSYCKIVSGTMISFSSNTEMKEEVEELDTFVRTDARLSMVIDGYRWLWPRAVMETYDRCVSTKPFCQTWQFVLKQQQ